MFDIELSRVEEMLLIGLIPLLFFVLFVIMHISASYQIDKAIKKKELPYEKRELKKIKILFVFYKRKDGIISEIAYRSVIRGHIFNFIFLVSIILSVIFINIFSYILMLTLGACNLIILLVSASTIGKIKK